MATWKEKVLAGDRLSIARLITAIENQHEGANELVDSLFPYTGKAYLIGITGAPGTGKSSLVNRLAYGFRHPEKGMNPKRVAVVAVDPSSPFSGGALLGDRVRMRDLTGDPGTFIRSMASRGSLGGLAPSIFQVIRVLDAAGFDLILIETVGVGQSEIEIARLAHTVLVVESPGMGDDIQAGKAGILEIGDILIVNKSDQPGADGVVRILKQMLEIGHTIYKNNGVLLHHSSIYPAKTSEQEDNEWQPPVIKTTAIQKNGMDPLFAEISKHYSYLQTSGEWIRKDKLRIRNEFEHYLEDAILDRLRKEIPEATFIKILDGLINKEYSPMQAIRKLIRQD